MAVRLFFWTVVFDIILRLQGSFADETCNPGNGENILITNVQNWEDLLQREDVKNLIKQLENEELASRIHFNFNIGEAEKTGSDDNVQEHIPTETDTPETTDTLCEKEWYNASDGHCYKLFESRSTFDAASENCGKQLNNSATLAIGIRNLTTRSEIISALKLKQSNSGRVIWIGLREENRKWFWADETEMKGEKGWKSGEPSNYPNEDCAALDTENDFNFGDFECSWSGYYICESTLSYNRKN